MTKLVIIFDRHAGYAKYMRCQFNKVGFRLVWFLNGNSSINSMHIRSYVICQDFELLRSSFDALVFMSKEGKLYLVLYETNMYDIYGPFLSKLGSSI